MASWLHRQADQFPSGFHLVLIQIPAVWWEMLATGWLPLVGLVSSGVVMAVMDGVRFDELCYGLSIARARRI